MAEVKMPQLGETVVEGTVTKWLKKEGDHVDEDELLVEISTDKVDSEIPSSAGGTIQKILVQEGDTVSVGTPLAIVGDGDAAPSDAGSSAEDGGAARQPAQDDGQAAQQGDDRQRGQAEAVQADQRQSDQEQDQEPRPADEQQGRAEAPTDQQQQGAGADDRGQAQAAQEQEAGGAADAGQAEGDATPGQEEQRRAEVGEAPGSGAPDQGEPEPSAAGLRPEGAPAEAAAAVRDRQDGSAPNRGIISPLVRRLADENDVRLEEVEGTGTGGRIRKQDVLRFVEERRSRPAPVEPAARPAAAQPAAPGTAPAQPAPAQAAPAQPAAVGQEQPAAQAPAGEREQLVPWTNIRRRTAEHMVTSSRETARAWNAVEVDWTNVVQLRGRAKGRFQAREGFNLTFMPFLAKAVCDTLVEMPEVNSAFDEQNQANLVKHYVNLGIAVALEGGGLIVPVVKSADEKNVPGLARAINDIATRARSKKLTPDDLTGGTFTITNPGPFGSKLSVPIIPHGQTAILAFEAIEKRVVVTDDDSIAIRSMGFLPMSWDHRVIDGAEAARFLARLRERIETTDFSADLSPYL